MAYSNRQLDDLVKNNPKELIRILSSPNIDAKTLAYGAELLGNEIVDENMVLPILRKLIKHHHAAVREGALIGISSFFMNNAPSSDIVEHVVNMANNDPSNNVREFAGQLMEEFAKRTD